MISILGAGAWGTALAVVFASMGHAVLLWTRDSQRAEEMSNQRENRRSLPGIHLTPLINITSSIDHIKHSDVLLIALPTQEMRKVLESFPESLVPLIPILSCSKGIEKRTQCFTTDIIRSRFKNHPIGVLSGPGFAAEIARGLPTAITLALDSYGLAQEYAERLGGKLFRLYYTDDVRGVEIGGAVKNVIAIAAGIVYGKDLGQSALAALVTRGFSELCRFGRAFNVKEETLMGLSGLGDLMLTCHSQQSRNFSLGVALGRGPSVASAGGLAEGMYTTAILKEIARQRGVDMPIVSCVEEIVSNRLSVDEAISTLLLRPQRGDSISPFTGESAATVGDSDDREHDGHDFS